MIPEWRKQCIKNCFAGNGPVPLKFYFYGRRKKGGLSGGFISLVDEISEKCGKQEEEKKWEKILDEKCVGEYA